MIRSVGAPELIVDFFIALSSSCQIFFLDSAG